MQGPTQGGLHAASRGAAIGQFWGTMLKLAIGAIIAVMLAIAAFV
jgi:hypothetical protein